MYILLYLLFYSCCCVQSKQRSCERGDQIPCPDDAIQCISPSDLCDGYKMCPAGSDEVNCGPGNCTAKQFYCPMGFCIAKTDTCNSYNECKDGFDEENCGPENCTADQTFCREGFCGYSCDFYTDCADGSDEENCGPQNCTTEQLFCPPRGCKQKCDGYNDCLDWTDEENCPPANCTDDMFNCANHQRICESKKMICDGWGICPDESDEDNCGPENCTTEQSFCSEGFCTLKCDGDKRCRSGTDEENCRPENCTDEQFFCPLGFCRPVREKCDDTNNCKDWSDEENCPLRNCTRAAEFRCSNGKCIPLWATCNKGNNCGDWSDEMNCSRTYCDEVSCPDGRCILSNHRCNGLNDCGDWSDETYCDCGIGWVSHRGKCYKAHISYKDITWQDAKLQCHDLNSTLASVTGPYDEKFLMRILLDKIKAVYIGLQKDYTNAIGTFKSRFLWDDGSSVTYQNWQNREPNGGAIEYCSLMVEDGRWKDIFCAEYASRQFVCMRYVFKDPREWLLPTILQTKEYNASPSWLKSCSSHEMTSKYKFCDGYNDCQDGSDEEKCDGSCENNQYQCENRECVSLNFYCDGIDDCGDNSDEKTCEMKSCSEDEWTCSNGQCIEERKRCDMRTDCYDETDEANCEMCRGFQCYDGKCIPQSWINDGMVDCDGYQREDEPGPGSGNNNPSVCLYGANEYGSVSFRTQPGKEDCASVRCPDTHFKCPYSYCIPVMFVCDGRRDCNNGEDELYCNRYVCHGNYRCQGQSFCIDPRQLCDGLRHCPVGDDERYCPLACSRSCECDGRVIRCDQNFTLQTTIPSDVRKLNLSGVIIRNDTLDLSDLHYLTILDLSYCQLATAEGLLVNNTNVIYLDLSNNALQRISQDTFSSLKRLRHLDLSYNILLTVETGAFLQLSSMKSLNLRNTQFGELHDKSFNGLSSMVKLNLANISNTKIRGRPFLDMKSLRSLDLRHNLVEQFSCCFLKHLESLQTLHTHSYQFCCDYMRPESLTQDNCFATLSDVISSCKDLLGTRTLKAILWLIVLFAMFGNIAVLVYRFKYDRHSLKRSYGMFVSNLSISDCLMGLYMLIIGSADAEYRGKYMSADYGWRHGHACRFAGFLSILSSEASCLFICLITLDRFLAIKYPFGDVKFTRRSTIIAIVSTWIFAVVLAAVPFFPSLKHWNLYSQNSVCLALPLNNEKKTGWQYSTIIFIGLNFILFLFIGLGQMLIYKELRAIPKVRGAGSTDAKVARRLFLVVMTDFLCWVPVGVMGIMSLTGIPINEEVFSWTAVTVLPVNSALNPLLYTLPSMIETWRKSNKQDQIKEPEAKDTPLPNHPSVRNTRRYVGKRTEDMETLGEVIKSSEISLDVKCVLLGLIGNYIYDLKRRNRNFEAVTTENVHVSRHGEEISAVCLSMKPDEDRHWQVEDVRYLAALLLSNIPRRKGKRHKIRKKVKVNIPLLTTGVATQYCARRGTY